MRIPKSTDLIAHCVIPSQLVDFRIPKSTS